MNAVDDVQYRLVLATEFLDTAERDFSRGEWPSCVAHSQLAVENGAKSVIACFEPVPQTHQPQNVLTQILTTNPDISANIAAAIRSLIESCGRLGMREHILASYGDERTRRTPSQIFGEPEANVALQEARNAIQNALQVIHHFQPEG